MSSRKDLAKKRQAAAELPESSQRKKTKTSKFSKATILDAQILNLVLGWPTPTDIARASQVCKNWQKGIDQYTWKQSAINVEPVAFLELEKAMGGKLQAQALAAGLSKLETICSTPIEFPNPTLRVQDIYVLVELEVFGHKTAMCKSLSGALQACDWEASCFLSVDFDDECKGPKDFTIEIPANLRDKIKLPTSRWAFLRDASAAFIEEKMTVSLSLWRVDTGQTCCLRRQRNYNEDLTDSWNNFSVEFYFISDDTRPVGHVATSLCHHHNYNFLQPYVAVYMEPILPQPGSDEEPEFLKVAREEEEYSQEMMDYLAKGDTTYRLSGLTVPMRFSVGDDECANDNVESEKHFMLILEGLDWT